MFLYPSIATAASEIQALAHVQAENFVQPRPAVHLDAVVARILDKQTSCCDDRLSAQESVKHAEEEVFREAACSPDLLTPSRPKRSSVKSHAKTISVTATALGSSIFPPSSFVSTSAAAPLSTFAATQLPCGRATSEAGEPTLAVSPSGDED